MVKVRTTLTIDADLLGAVQLKAARLGRSVSEVIENSVRRDVAPEFLDRAWCLNDMSEGESMSLAIEAQHATRARRRSGP